MEHQLSSDEYDALEQVSKLGRNDKPSACVKRNAKRLTGIKMLAYRKDGGLELTESGRQFLFIKQCIDGLRLLAQQAGAHIPSTVAAFLSKKGHVQQNLANGQLEISAKGRECLADIEASKK